MKTELTVRNPYPGPRPFEQQEKDFFFGREREVGELLSLVTAHREVLLYAQSGAGKSSLLNAGLIPKLVQEEFQVLPPARASGFEPKGINRREIDNIYVFNTLMSWDEDDVDPSALCSTSLANFLEKREHRRDEDGLLLPRAVIFDQFEELFMFYPERWRDREGFFRQVGDALKEDPLLRVLFVIREDYLANLDPYIHLLPEGLRTHFRLERLRAEAACDAIEGPLRGSGRSFAKGVASKLVQQLLNIRVESVSGETVKAPGEYVEPVQLQVVCRNLWDSLPLEVTEIASDHLQDFGDVDKALGGFYLAAIQAVRRKTRTSEKVIRRWFESRLITPAGTRGTVFRGEKRTGGIRNAAVEVLVGQHIIRAEMRARARWYELTHDRLVAPIQASNQAWRRRRRRRRCLVLALSLFVLFVFTSLVQVRQVRKRRTLYDNAYLEGYTKSAEKTAADFIKEKDAPFRDGVIRELIETRTPELIKRVIEKEDERRETKEKTLVATVRSLWQQDKLDELVGYLKENDANIPKDLGVNMSQSTKDVNLVSVDERWPLALEYSSDRKLDEKELLCQWSEFAGRMAYMWGIPVPRRIKFKKNDRLSADEFNVLAVSLVPAVRQEPDTSKKSPVNIGRRPAAVPVQQSTVQEIPGVDRIPQPRTRESIAEQRLVIPSLPNHVLIGEKELPERLRPFFDQHREEWTALPQIEHGGPWWLVPRWTQPLWEIEDYRASPAETAVAFIAAKLMLDEANLVLTRDCVDYLLERTREQSPQTVAEALAIRGGVAEIQRDLIEVVGQYDYPLTRLEYLLDALAGCGGLSTAEAADRAVAAQQSIAIKGWKLQGSQARAPMVANDEQPKAEFRRVYADAGLWLPDHLPAIRVYLGREIEGRITTKDSQLTPDVLEALADVRGMLYKRFGLIPPGVRFRPAEEGLAENAVRIEAVNQTNSDDDAQSIDLTLDNALGQLLQELRFRYVGLRTWWLTAEKVHWELMDLQEPLREWLRAHFALTDIKLILRAVIAPTEDELTAYAEGGWTEDGLGHTVPEQTLQDLPWLLGSLTFWVNVVNMLDTDAQELADFLRRTQGARLNTVRDNVAEGKAANHVRRGIEELRQSSMAVAASAFKDAVQVDRDEAVKAFLLLYAKESRLAPENYLEWLEARCSLPDPGDYSTLGQPSMQTRYELEEFLDEAATDIPADTRLRLKLCLLWNYFEQEHGKKRDELLDQLLSGYDPNRWSAKEEYFLAYRVLSASAEETLQLDYQDSVEKLLKSAFKHLPDKQADDAFRELMRFYSSTRAPTWHAALLHSLVDLRPLSYWIPYRLGEYLANSGGHDEAKKALDLLKRAESNLSVTEADQSVQRAWINFKKATAYYTLAWKGVGDYDQQSVSNALKLFENLVANVPPDAERWPPLDLIYTYLVSTYVWADKVDEAATEAEKGLSLFSDSAKLLRQSGFIYHDRLFKYREAYEKYRKVLELEPNDVSNTTNFAEANLTTERFEEAYRLARKLLTESAASDMLTTDREMAMRFVMISSLVLQGHADDARKELREFIGRYNSIIGEYKPEWSYKGTEHFITERPMDEEQRRLLLNLIDILETATPKNITMEQIKGP